MGFQTKHQTLERAAGVQQNSDSGQHDLSFGTRIDLGSVSSSLHEAGDASSPDILKLMQRVFSHPAAIYWHILRDCCGFCFVYHLANEVFAFLQSLFGRNLQFIMLCFICSPNTGRDCTESLQVVKCLILYLTEQYKPGKKITLVIHTYPNH